MPVFPILSTMKINTLSKHIKYIGDNSYLVNGWVVNGTDLYPHKR